MRWIAAVIGLSMTACAPSQPLPVATVNQTLSAAQSALGVTPTVIELDGPVMTSCGMVTRSAVCRDTVYVFPAELAVRQLLTASSAEGMAGYIIAHESGHVWQHRENRLAGYGFDATRTREIEQEAECLGGHVLAVGGIGPNEEHRTIARLSGGASHGSGSQRENALMRGASGGIVVCIQ